MAAQEHSASPQFRWTESDIADEGFRDRFLKLPMIIDTWVSPYLSLKGSRVLDFGCGEGITALGLTLKHAPAEVIGVDIMPDPDRCPEQAKKHLGLETLPETMHLHRVRAGELPDEARDLDLIYAWSVFEHVDQTILGEVLGQLLSRLKPRGLLFVQIAPLYYSSLGSHLCHKVPEPWGHLTTQTNLYEARLRAACESEEEFESLWSTFRTLNRITAEELEQAIVKAQFKVLRKYTTTETAKPPATLTAIFKEAVLRTDQVVILARK